MKTLLLVWTLAVLPGLEEAILFLSGASCIEELAEEEIQLFHSLAAHPIDLNRAGRTRLLSTGLLSEYQVASLLDYRERSGEILSWTELALVDGFPADYVAALREFAVLGIHNPPGQRKERRVSGELELRSSIRDGSPSWGIKTEVHAGERAALFWSLRSRPGELASFPGTLSGAWLGRGALDQLIVGHFQARFGQGLLQWSGFSLSGYTSPASMRRNGSGFSPTGSFSPQLAGLATDWHFGSWYLSAGYSFEESRPILHLSRSSRSLTAGLGATSEGISADFQFGRAGWSLYGEAAYLRISGFRALAGVFHVPQYGSKAAFLLRWMGVASDYSGVAAGYETPSWQWTTDAGWRMDRRTFQWKSVTLWKPEALSGRRFPGLAWEPLLRIQLRWRPAEAVPKEDDVTFFASSGIRLDLRGSLAASAGPWCVAVRGDAVWGRKFAWQTYAESGWRQEKAALWLRGALFRVDRWEDRIYVYERDAPGSFNVPARYGRGWNVSFYAVWQPVRYHSFWLRLETLQYPWNLSPKDGRTEIRLQYRYRW